MWFIKYLGNTNCMQLNVDGIGKFVEYTLKPIIEDAGDMFDKMRDLGFTRNDCGFVLLAFVLERLTYWVGTIIVTSMICFTLLHCLNTKI